MLVPTLDAFDYSNTTSPLGERAVTTVAPQALMLLNDDFMEQQAGAFANRLSGEAGDRPEQQIRRGYQLAIAREPTSRELRTASAYLKRQAAAFKTIRSRLTFRPDVPASLSVEYMNQLKASEFLIGPGQGWSYYRGRWATAYEGIRTVDRQCGPFALWDGERFQDGVIEAKIVLDRASEYGSILFRASADKDEVRGYELILDSRQQRIILRRHQTNIIDLAAATTSLPLAQPIALKIEFVADRVRVWLNGAAQPTIEMCDPTLMNRRGSLGISTWGAPLNIDDLTLITSRGKLEIRPNPIGIARRADTPAQRALQSFCLLLLNLNEVIYVD
jgi:hypothetical protein